jgi:hypothetical protein
MRCIHAVTLVDSRRIFRRRYDFLAFLNNLEGPMNGRYTLAVLNDKLFAEILGGKLDAIAYPREQAGAVPQP